MYQNIYINKKDWTVYLWDDERGLTSFPYPKYAYRRKPNGKFTSIYGDELEKIYDYKDSEPNLFESDVPAETRVLMDYYPDSDEPSKGHKLGVIDIEVSTEGGFPNMETADKKIIGISLFDVNTKTCHVFVLDEDSKINNTNEEVEPWLPKDWKIVTDEEKQKVKISVHSFSDEDNLLIGFMDKWRECSFTIITGWNVDYFDMPYLYLRLKYCLGAKAAKCLSPISAAYLNSFTKKLTVGGISIIDYMLLFKKFSGKMEPTYALGPIGLKNVGIGKIQYKGNLDDLYKTDINKFLEYNINDVKIVVALDRKFKFIDLAKNICHVGHVPYDNFHMSSRYLDGASLIYLKRNGGYIAPNKPSKGREEYEERLEEGEEGFSGAYVKEPVPGRYSWVFDLDLTSMYPNIIISLNISPETKISKIKTISLTEEAKLDKRKRLIEENKNQESKNIVEDGNLLEEWIEKRMKEFDNKYHVTNQISSYDLGITTYTDKEFQDLIKNSNYSLSSNGVLYRQDKMGLVPTLLSLWFSQRKEMRKKAAGFKKDGNIEMYNFYNQRQNIYKVLLNSFYGVLGLPVFRFYDVENAEAVTMTGVDVIQTTGKIINQYYSKMLGKKYKIIYEDGSEEIVYENQSKLLENGNKIKDVIHTQ